MACRHKYLWLEMLNGYVYPYYNVILNTVLYYYIILYSYTIIPYHNKPACFFWNLWIPFFLSVSIFVGLEEEGSIWLFSVLYSTLPLCNNRKITAWWNHYIIFFPSWKKEFRNSIKKNVNRYLENLEESTHTLL